jgi:hypothetical protein
MVVWGFSLLPGAAARFVLLRYFHFTRRTLVAMRHPRITIFNPSLLIPNF